MEGFLVANRIAEVSLTKLNRIHKCGELPLRKTLLISKVLNTAQDVATSAQLSFFNDTPSTTSRSTSKLLASISKRVEDSDVCESDCAGLSRPSKQLSRQQSPLTNRVEEDDESMDFENVSSVLSDILESDVPAAVPNLQEDNAARTERKTDNKNRGSFLSDVTNTAVSGVWGSWQFEVNAESKNAHKEQWQQWSSTPPLTSPGKRHHKDAFPSSENDNSTISLSSIWEQDDLEETKRFKPSPPEGCQLECLPGFCGYLSPKNLQSAPLITYMFGSGFSSNPSSNGWTPSFQENGTNNYSENHFESPLPPTPPVKFNPILAF